MTPLARGSVIGVLGGGQLGRMLALAGARLGFDVHILDPDPDAPAGRVAAKRIAAQYDDHDAVAAFAADCDAVTYEFENIPTTAVRAAAVVCPVRPGVRALEVAQDRVTEKTFVTEAGAAATRFAAVATRTELDRALPSIGIPALLKTRRMGYDGKGQARITDAAAAALDAAWDEMKGAPAILEAHVDFVRELSVIAARGADGAIAVYPLAENRHENGVLRESRAPAPAAEPLKAEAEAIVRALLAALDYVGVLAVELFETSDGALLVNEMAPRVHNSGHWTLDAAACDQFEQHIRAVAGWPLGGTEALTRARMVNLLGDDIARAETLAARPDARLHLYGKRETRPGRKMGHVTFLGETSD